MAKTKGAVSSERLTAIMWIVWKLWIKRGGICDKRVKPPTITVKTDNS